MGHRRAWAAAALVLTSAACGEDGGTEGGAARRYLVVARGSEVRSYELEADSGQLGAAQVSPTGVPGGERAGAVSAVAFDPDRGTLYLSAANEVWGFRLQPGGSVRPLAGTPYPSPPFASRLLLPAHGRTLLAMRAGCLRCPQAVRHAELWAFDRDAASGALARRGPIETVVGVFGVDLRALEGDRLALVVAGGDQGHSRGSLNLYRLDGDPPVTLAWHTDLTPDDELEARLVPHPRGWFYARLRDAYLRLDVDPAHARLALGGRWSVPGRTYQYSSGTPLSLLSADGRFLYDFVSVFGADPHGLGISVLAVDAATGRLSPVQYLPTPGLKRATFAAGGRVLVADEQPASPPRGEAPALLSFKVDVLSGRIEPAFEERLPAGLAACALVADGPRVYLASGSFAAGYTVADDGRLSALAATPSSVSTTPCSDGALLQR